MKSKIKFYILLILIFGGWVFALYFYFHRIDFGLVALAVFESVITVLIIAAIKCIIWRVKNGVDLFATLETDPEKVKEHMLFIMQYGNGRGVEGVLEELNEIFRNYPQWELENWKVFRAWYKHIIDLALENSQIYVLTMKDGREYDKENDPLYSPDAPDWAQFDRPRYSVEDDDDEDDDEYTDTDNGYRKSAEDGFFTGLGLGASNTSLIK
ncbi:MAG: hypothetical protein K2M06_07800 [Muribaculaceae bacterium]|nr:hypothetical protein [Muribaculaceae bacterium]